MKKTKTTTKTTKKEISLKVGDRVEFTIDVPCVGWTVPKGTKACVERILPRTRQVVFRAVIKTGFGADLIYLTPTHVKKAIRKVEEPTFKIGDRVEVMISGCPTFYGEVINIRPNQTHPYVVRAEQSGIDVGFMASQLKLAPKEDKLAPFYAAMRQLVAAVKEVKDRGGPTLELDVNIHGWHTPAELHKHVPGLELMPLPKKQPEPDSLPPGSRVRNILDGAVGIVVERCCRNGVRSAAVDYDDGRRGLWSLAVNLEKLTPEAPAIPGFKIGDWVRAVKRGVWMTGELGVIESVSVLGDLRFKVRWEANDSFSWMAAEDLELAAKEKEKFKIGDQVRVLPSASAPQYRGKVGIVVRLERGLPFVACFHELPPMLFSPTELEQATLEPAKPKPEGEFKVGDKVRIVKRKEWMTGAVGEITRILPGRALPIEIKWNDLCCSWMTAEYLELVEPESKFKPGDVVIIKGGGIYDGLLGKVIAKAGKVDTDQYWAVRLQGSHRNTDWDEQSLELYKAPNATIRFEDIKPGMILRRNGARDMLVIRADQENHEVKMTPLMSVLTVSDLSSAEFSADGGASWKKVSE